MAGLVQAAVRSVGLAAAAMAGHNVMQPPGSSGGLRADEGASSSQAPGGRAPPAAPAPAGLLSRVFGGSAAGRSEVRRPARGTRHPVSSACPMADRGFSPGGGRRRRASPHAPAPARSRRARARWRRLGLARRGQD